ncbi:transketolase C-terminal domain-containing protein [Mycolicibacterium sp. 624]|uniref:alpha-ketoacid dehydrogenase subunit beta n=1 Tax=Mycolicibacterium sp. 624 TaxID=3156314 RepID=UPI0033931C54
MSLLSDAEPGTEVSDDGSTRRSVELTYKAAIQLALEHSLRADTDVIFIGEDVAAAGGVFKCSEGLLETFGPDRVMDMPIAEYGFAEVALGMGISGMRPIVEIMFADFLGVAASAIAVDFPRYRLTSGGQMKAPITIRTVGGLGWHFGAQHSMTYESWFQGMPGLRIAVSARPASAYRNIRAAVHSDNPVLIIEHKLPIARKELVEVGPPDASSIGRAEVLRAGRDITVVASLECVWTALAAAASLAESGVSVEVIDIAWIRPLDVATVIGSVSRTGRLLVLMEDYFPGSWASTLLAEITMRGTRLKAAPEVVHLPDDLPVPFSPVVEMAMLPDAGSVAAKIARIVRGDDRGDEHAV